MRPIYPVEDLHALDAGDRYCDAKIFIISWPPYGDETMIEICARWGTGRPIVYIGERDGCHAPARFWESFQPDPTLPVSSIPTWPLLHDQVWVGSWNPADRGWAKQRA